MSDRNVRIENSYVQYIQLRQAAPSIESILIFGALLGDVQCSSRSVRSRITDLYMENTSINIPDLGTTPLQLPRACNYISQEASLLASSCS